MQLKKLVIFTAALLVTNSSWSELPIALKAMKSVDAKVDADKSNATLVTPADGNKTPPKLPWEVATATADGLLKRPVAETVKPIAEKSPSPKTSNSPTLDKAVNRIDESMYATKKGKKVAPTLAVVEAPPVAQDASWSMRMARANEEQLLLEQQLKNADLRKKLDAAGPVKTNHSAIIASLPDVLPVVRAVEISQTRSMVTAEYEGTTNYVRVGGSVGKWNIVSAKLNAVTFNDGRKSFTVPVVFPIQSAPGSQAAPIMQPFLMQPTSVPPPPRVNGGAR